MHHLQLSVVDFTEYFQDLVWLKLACTSVRTWKLNETENKPQQYASSHLNIVNLTLANIKESMWLSPSTTEWLTIFLVIKAKNFTCCLCRGIISEIFHSYLFSYHVMFDMKLYLHFPHFLLSGARIGQPSLARNK